MSIGKRRPKLSRAQLRPADRGLHQAGSPGQAARPGRRCSRCGRSRCRGHRGDRPRLRAARSPTGSASARPRDPGQRQGIPGSATRPRPATSGRRPPTRSRRRWSTIPAPIRDLAERLDDLTVDDRQGRPIRGPPRERPGGLEARARGLRRAQGGHRHPRAARQAARVRSPRRSQPLLRDGVLGPGTLPPNEESSRHPVDPHSRASRRHLARLVPRDRVVPERIVKPDGPVFQEFCAAFTSPRIGQILFGLIADQLDGTPTLTFEAEATAQLREEARAASPTITTPTRAARCSSSRARRSARSS